MPDAGAYLLSWFGELSAARSSNGFGANPIGYAEMKAWADLTGRALSAFDVNVLRRLDVTLLTVFARKDDDG